MASIIKVTVGLLATLAIAYALPQSPRGYDFSDGYDQIVPDIVESFSCEGRNYGYYADVQNYCQIFHICLPIPAPDPEENIILETYQWSFHCPNQTVFSQESLVCIHADDPFFNCQDSELYYNSVEFGKIPESN